jgi:nitric oxide reductase NorQ protein
LLVAAARLVGAGLGEREACHAAIVAPLSDEPTLVSAMDDLVDATFL